MMCNHNAGERTYAEVVSLLSEAGWRVEEVHQFHETWLPQIVAVPIFTNEEVSFAKTAYSGYDAELRRKTHPSYDVALNTVDCKDGLMNHHLYRKVYSTTE